MQNNQSDFKPSALGSNADLQAGVDIAKFMGGYFGNPANVLTLCEVGIKGILTNLPKDLLYVDFGGGEGTLAKAVDTYLRDNEKNPDTIVVDSNPEFLKQAEAKGLKTELANIESSKLENVDLATMRAVIHYNPQEKQLDLIKSVAAVLKPGGYLVHQVSSGSVPNVRLRSAIVNLKSLGRANENEHYYWAAIDESLSLHQQAGFSSVELVGYAPASKWGAVDQWNRMNGNKTRQAEAENNLVELENLAKRREVYLGEANNFMEQYLREYGAEESGVEKLSDGSYTIHYPYPVFVCRK